MVARREQFANDARTSLNGAINDSVLTLVVDSAGDFPTSGNFRLLLSNEIILQNILAVYFTSGLFVASYGV